MTRHALPNPVSAGEALAKLDPTQAALFVLIFVIVALMGVIAWLLIQQHAAIRTFNKITEALWALRVTLLEDRTLAREDQAQRALERKIDRDQAAVNAGREPEQ